MAPLALHVPAGQSEHDVLGLEVLYVPAAQVEALAWPVAEVKDPLVAAVQKVEPPLGW